jgi:hypothetical protein
MNLSHNLKFSISVLLSSALILVPGRARASMEMISTGSVVAELSRHQTEEKVQEFLQRSDVRTELAKRGVAADELSKRVASLSDQELQTLSGQVDKAQAGGDTLVIGLGTLIIIVLLIILLRR